MTLQSRTNILGQTFSGKNLGDDFAVHVGEPEIATGMFEGQLFVIES